MDILKMLDSSTMQDLNWDISNIKDLLEILKKEYKNGCSEKLQKAIEDAEVSVRRIINLEPDLYEKSIQQIDEDKLFERMIKDVYVDGTYTLAEASKKYNKYESEISGYYLRKYGRILSNKGYKVNYPSSRKSDTKLGKYTEAQRKESIDTFKRVQSIPKTLKILGYGSTYYLSRWIEDDKEASKLLKGSTYYRDRRTVWEKKLLEVRDTGIVQRELGYPSVNSIHAWRNRILCKYAKLYVSEIALREKIYVMFDKADEDVAESLGVDIITVQKIRLVDTYNNKIIDCLVNYVKSMYDKSGDIKLDDYMYYTGLDERYRKKVSELI